MLDVMFDFYPVLSILFREVQLLLSLYLDTNLMQRIGSTRPLNNMSEVDNDTTKGVVT